MRVVYKQGILGSRWSKIAIGFVGLALMTVLGAAIIKLVNAAPVPAVSISDLDTTPMIGENTTFTVSFQNNTPDNKEGYGPYVDLILPDELSGSTPTATYLGTPVTLRALTTPSTTDPSACTAGQQAFNHPLARTSTGALLEVCVPDGQKVYVAQLPFGSFAPGQTTADLRVTVPVAADASLIDPLTVQARGGFYLGADALNNSTSDPSITGGFIASDDIYPTVLKLRKQYISSESGDDTSPYLKNEYEIVPGANHKQRFRLIADVAAGQTVTDLQLRDTLPSPLLRVAQVDVTPVGSSDSSAGNTAELTWSSITGVPGSNHEAQFDIVFEVPYKDGDGNEAWTRAVLNEATADADYEGAPLPQITAQSRNNGGNGDVQQLHIKPMITQKTVSPSGARKPGDILTYTIRMYLSDYIAMNTMQVVDTLPDGMAYQTGSATLQLPGDVSPAATADPTNTSGVDDTDILTFDIPNTAPLVGGCVPLTGTGGLDPDCATENRDRTVVTLSFQAQINETYTDNATVLQGHVLDNRVTTTANLLSPYDVATQTGTAQDSSNAAVRIIQGGITKDIYAVNGDTTLPSRLKPGDQVTYRLRYSVPNTDFGQIVLDDYLPMPMFDGTEVGVGNFDADIDSTTPAAGRAKFGPLETLHGYGAGGNPVPAISHDSGNVLRFTWDAQSDNANGSRLIDILFTVTILDKQYAPGLFITNQATATEDNVSASAMTTDIKSIEMEIPEPEVTKGVVASTAAGNPSPAYTPANPYTFTAPGSSGTRFTGTISDGSTLDSDLANVDAGDIITYAFAVENTGKGSMFNTRLSDQLPANMVIPSGGLNLRVTDGTGAALAYADNGGSPLFDITLDDAIPGNDAAAGENLVVVTYDLEVMSDVQPRDTIINTAQLTQFTASADVGAQNYVAGQEAQYQDDATVTAKPPVIAKTITGTSRPETSGNNILIGEEVTYAVTVAIPEGTLENARIVDTLQSCLAVTRINSITPSVGLTTTAQGGDWDAIRANAAISNQGAGAANQGRVVGLDFGTLTNSNTDNSVAETITISLDAVAINASGCVNGQSRTNTAVFEWGSAMPRETVSATSPSVTIREPNVILDKTIAPAAGDANDVFAVTLRVRGDASSSRSNAYEVAVTDDLAAQGFTYVDGLSMTGLPTADTFAVTGNILTAEWNTLPAGSDGTITFNARLTSDVHAAGSVHTNIARATFTGFPGVPTGINTHNTLACERTGDTLGCGAAMNTYARTASDSYQIHNVTNLQKSIVATSETHTTGNNVAIGEIVRYRLAVQVPESTTNNFVVRDVLPGGLEYLGNARVALVGTDNVTSSTASGAFVVGNDANVTPSTTIVRSGSGQTVEFNLGTLSNTDSDADSEYVVIEFNALVRNIAANERNSSLANQFAVVVNGTQQGSLSNVVASTVQAPIVDVAKTVTNPPTDAGDMVEYTLVVRNNLGANATTGYNLTLTDELHHWLTNASIQSVSTLGYGGAITHNVTAATTPGTTSDNVTVTIPELRPGDAVTVVIRATVHNNAQASFTLPNTAVVTTTSLPGPNGTTINPTGQSTPGATNDANGERRQSTNSSANTTLGDPAITKLGPTEGANATIGSTVTYPITVRLPQGTTQNVSVIDHLPQGLSYVSHAVDSNSLAGVTTTPTLTMTANGTGTDVALGFGTIVIPGDSAQFRTFTVTIVATVLDIPENEQGDVLTNTAIVRYTDPNTGDSRDISSLPRNVTIQEPNLVLTKSLSGVNPRVVGSALSYTVSIENNGSAPAHEWSIVDVLPPHTTVTSQPSCTIGGTAITTATTGTATITTRPNPATAHVLAAGATATCVYQLTVQPSAVAGSTYINTAHATWRSLPSSGNPDSRMYSGNEDTASFTMVGADFTKEVDATTAAIGDVRTYTLTINAPSGAVNNLSLQDVLPVGLEFLSTTAITNASSITPTVSGSGPTTVTWSFGDINHNGLPIIIQYQARVTNIVSNQDGVDRTNNAQVQFTPEASAAVTQTDSATITVREPVLTVQKAVNNPLPNYGQEVTYTLDVRHAAESGADAFDVVVEDTVPAGLTLVPGSVSGGGWSITVSGNGFSATRNEVLMADIGTITYRAIVNAPPSAPAMGASLVNTVDLMWTSLAGDSPHERTGAGGTNDYQTSDTETVSVGAIDLAVAKTDGGISFIPGQTIPYGVVVSNLGDRTAHNVIVTEVVPQHTTFNAAASAPGWACVDDAAGSLCTFEVSSLAPGANQAMLFAVDIDDYDTIPAGVVSVSNNISVAGDPSDGVEATTGNNSDAVSSPLQVADIAVTKVDSDDPVLLGGDYGYTITVRNNGPAEATNVRVDDMLPDGVSYRMGSLQVVGAPASSCDVADNTLTCGIATLAMGDEVVITLGVTGNTPGGKLNTVSARADQQDSNRNNNSDEEATAVGLVDISLRKVVSKGTVKVGEKVEFTLTVRNDGPDIARNVVLTDVLPSGLQILDVISSHGNCVINGQTITCELGDMDIDDEIVITYQTRVLQVGTFASIAAVHTLNYEVSLLNNEDSAEVVATILAPNSGVGRLLNIGSLIGAVSVFTGLGGVLLYRYRHRRV